MSQKFDPVFHAALEAARAMLAEERAAKYHAGEGLNHPAKLAEVLRPYFAGREQEVFVVVLLSSTLHLMGAEVLYRGTADAINVRPAEVFRRAVQMGARFIAVAHNHPGGDPTPSMGDWEVTEGLVKAGEILEIPLVDHLVFGGDDWVSMRAQVSTFWPPDEESREYLKIAI